MSVGFTGSQIALFLVVLARVSGFIVSAPIVGDPQVPRLVKAGLAIVLSFVLAGLPNVGHTRIPSDLIPFVLVIVVQLLIGIMLGFVARTLFYAIQAAGQIASLQMGLSTAAVLNPMTQESDPIISQFYTIVAGLTFLAVKGDLWVVAALARSFDLAPLTVTALSPALIKGTIEAAIGVTALGLQITLPLAASLFAANVLLGVVSRALPQLNVFVLSMPLDLILGLLTLIAGLTGMIIIFGHASDALPQMMLAPLG